MNSITLEQKLENTQDELRQVKNTLGTLIAWLQVELGNHNVDTLLKMLNDKQQTKENQ